MCSVFCVQQVCVHTRYRSVMMVEVPLLQSIPLFFVSMLCSNQQDKIHVFVFGCVRQIRLFEWRSIIAFVFVLQT